VCQRQLVNVAKPLERTRIEDGTLVGIQTNEHMDSISDLMEVLLHVQLSAGTVPDLHSATPRLPLCTITLPQSWRTLK
jgi:hypothetical protein